MRKTGLFIPYWVADRRSDGLKSVEQERVCFDILKSFYTVLRWNAEQSGEAIPL